MPNFTIAIDVDSKFIFDVIKIIRLLSFQSTTGLQLTITFLEFLTKEITRIPEVDFRASITPTCGDSILQCDIAKITDFYQLIVVVKFVPMLVIITVVVPDNFASI